MRHRATRTPRARRDILDQAEYLALEGGIDVAERYLDALEQAEQSLLDTPGLGAERTFGRIEGLRMWRVPGFEKHLIFYRETADGIEIIRVLHGARDLAGLFDDDPFGNH